MKAWLQFATSVVALGGLLGSVASHATDVAELPLKASVLAKPNVIFGMDDSGSMDWEILLDTPSGVAYWDNGSAWDSGTNRPRTSSTQFNPLQYLFPVGTATGGQIYPTTNGNGRSAAPINELAWLRSFRFNPLYYNPSVTYRPWSPAYVSGSLKTYADATPTAARTHPEVAASPTLNLTVDWNATSQPTAYSADDTSFRILGGMTLPTGSSVPATNPTSGACTNNPRRTLTQAVTVGNGGSCLAGMAYYPATYWQPTVCPTGMANCVPAPDCTLGNDCINAPNGVGKLRRYEIREGNTFPTGSSYAAEMQNFANWFSYHRKRKLMLAGSMGQVLENITGLRMGVVPFNDRGTVTMNDADSTTASANRLAVAGRFYLNAMSGQGTPTLTTIKHIGTQFDTDTNIVKFACQRNSTFIVTDGFANDLGTSTPSYDASKWGTGSPYATTFDATQASLALAYYTNRLRASGGAALPAGLVEPSSSNDPAADKNTDLHVNFYAISLGVTGSQYQPGRNPYTNPPTWTMPVNDDPSMIDDLWHATINGRGKMYLATTPTETTASIEAGLNDILNFTGAQSGVSVSSVNLSRGDGFAYMGRYNPSRWSGDLTANVIDGATGAISTTATWSAAALLDARPWTGRVIVSSFGGAGVDFSADAVGATVNPGGVYGTTTDVIAYLRGDRSKEGTTFRSRASLMGAVINAEPAIARDEEVAYVASGEGMLHAFDLKSGADRGKELWAFVPGPVLPDIGQTTARSYAFKTQLDGTPVVGNVGGTKLLVAGMGAAGRHYYALDVTNPRSNTAGNAGSWVKWTFPDAGNATKVGQTLGKPLIVKTSAGYRVLVTSGYNSTADGLGRLFVLNPSTGAVEKEFVTTDGTLTNEAGLAHVAGFQENDGSVRYVYGGDLRGNVWRFDLDAASLSAPKRLAILKGPSGTLQPVTAPPELTLYKGKRIVLVGTGRLLDVTDWGNNAVQSFYAMTDETELTNARTALVEQVYTRSGDKLTTKPVDWATQRGWYMDLPAGEHANTRPTVAFSSVAFVTNVAGANDCSASSWFYVIDIATGGKSPTVNYVASQVSSTQNSSAATVVATNGQKPSSDGPPPPPPPPPPGGGGDCSPQLKGLMQTSNGQSVIKDGPCGDKVQPSKNTWREVRRR